MSCFLHAPIHHCRRLGLAMLVAIGLCGVTTAGSATPTASADTYTCGFSNSFTTGNGLSWILMSNGAWNLVRVSGRASFRTCPNGSIFVDWSPSLIDNHNDLSFLGGYMQFRTNRGRVITSSRQYVTGFYGAQATSAREGAGVRGGGSVGIRNRFSLAQECASLDGIAAYSTAN